MIPAASIKRVSVDIGKNVTIKCPLNSSRDVMWEREGKKQDQTIKMTVLETGSLFLVGVDKSDSGIYSCIRENDVKDIRGKVNVTVRSKLLSYIFLYGLFILFVSGIIVLFQ